MQSLNQVLAANLRHWMDLRGLSPQAKLAEASKVAQRTISSCLNVENRLGTKTGRQPSVTLTNLEKLASALKVPAWVLLRPSSAQNEDQFLGVVEAKRDRK